MVTIKAYTDLEQSKKLAEILPFDDADNLIDASNKLIDVCNKLTNVCNGLILRVN